MAKQRKIKDVHCGNDFTLLLSYDGVVMATGSNRVGKDDFQLEYIFIIFDLNRVIYLFFQVESC